MDGTKAGAGAGVGVDVGVGVESVGADVEVEAAGMLVAISADGPKGVGEAVAFGLGVTVGPSDVGAADVGVQEESKNKKTKNKMERRMDLFFIPDQPRARSKQEDQHKYQRSGQHDGRTGGDAHVVRDVQTDHARKRGDNG